MSRDITELPPVPAGRRIAYGTDRSQFFDLFLPKVREARGAAMMIHGGFWRARYDLAHASHLCAVLADQGVAIANLEYRRVGEHGGGWPGSFEDVLTGFDAVSRELGKPVVLGHSAGGHLALRMSSEREAVGVVALAPVADLKMAYDLNLSNGAAMEFVGGSPREEPHKFESADPRRHSSRVARLLLHGTDDHVVPLALSDSYIRERGTDAARVRLDRLEGANHFDVIDPGSSAWKFVVSAVRELLG